MRVQFKQTPARPEWQGAMETEWFDPHDYADGDEFREAVEEWALASDVASGFEAYDLDDCPVIPDYDDWDEMVELADVLHASYFDSGALEAIAEYESWSPGDLIDNIDDAEERFAHEGEGEEYAESYYGDSYYSELRRLPDEVKDNIDWAAVWEYMSSDYTEIYHNGITYIFRDS